MLYLDLSSRTFYLLRHNVTRALRLFPSSFGGHFQDKPDAGDRLGAEGSTLAHVRRVRVDVHDAYGERAPGPGRLEEGFTSARNPRRSGTDRSKEYLLLGPPTDTISPCAAVDSSNASTEETG